MEFKQFYLEGLFGLYNHTIDFSASKTASEKASIVMIYGNNGVGKTTILRMIEGLMTLNFNIFRQIRFSVAQLSFSNEKIIRIKSIYNENKDLDYLDVKYGEKSVKLHPKDTGPFDESQREPQNEFVMSFEDDMNHFSFDFIDTERLIKQNLREEIILHEQKGIVGKISTIKKETKSTHLTTKVKKFITESQVYNDRFFSNEEPALFEKILKNIETPSDIDIDTLTNKIALIDDSINEFQTARLGLAQEKWDKDKFLKILNDEKNSSKPDLYKLTLINSYLEVLESRNNEVISLASRLLTFENILNNFLLDKNITVSTKKGFEIKSENDNQLSEEKLSTGEYHLLYLTILALCTTVKGTVIAIDEPEMSMHVSWQNKLINALLKISAKANPQFIFATHSPDIAANYSNSLQTEKYGKN